jgi:hypothetical protein
MRYLLVLIPLLFLPLPASADPPWAHPHEYERTHIPPRERMEEWRARERMEHRLRWEYCERHLWDRECRR